MREKEGYKRMSGKTIRATYEPYAPGRVLCYHGEVTVCQGDSRRSAEALIELELAPCRLLICHLFERSSISAGEGLWVEIEGSGSLGPPERLTALRAGSDVRSTYLLGEVQAGDLENASALALHFTGDLDAGSRGSSSDTYPEIELELPGWALTLFPLGPKPDGAGFCAWGIARPLNQPIETCDLEPLTHSLQAVLSLASGRQIGVGPLCGTDDAGEVLWARWQAPDHRLGKGAHRLISPEIAPLALPEIAVGLTRLEPDGAGMLREVFERALDGYLAANAPEDPPELRLRSSLAVTELVAKAVLERAGWTKARGALEDDPGQVIRLLLKWAGIPTEVPRSLPRLWQRAREMGGHVEGPEVLDAIREDLGHPSVARRGHADEGSELLEALELACWYLELTLLRLLGYEGEYESRLSEGEGAMALERVPWVAGW